jgi:chromosome segregation ATPase
MATRPQPPNAAAAEDESRAATGRDDRTEQALARSREIREQTNRQIQEVREQAATARKRPDTVASSWPAAQDSATRLLSASEEIERSRQARARLAELAARLVQTEETVAHIHDEMAGRDSGRAAQYRRAADDARQAACRAREIQRNAAGSDPR